MSIYLQYWHTTFPFVLNNFSYVTFKGFLLFYFILLISLFNTFSFCLALIKTWFNQWGSLCILFWSLIWRFRVCLDTTENWKYCSKIIFKCVNSPVKPIFNFFFCMNNAGYCSRAEKKKKEKKKKGWNANAKRVAFQLSKPHLNDIAGNLYDFLAANVGIAFFLLKLLIVNQTMNGR